MIQVFQLKVLNVLAVINHIDARNVTILNTQCLYIWRRPRKLYTFKEL